MEAAALLRRAGWFPGRCVDTARARSCLFRAGYRVTTAGLEVLREYSGLVVTSADGTRQPVDRW